MATTKANLLENIRYDLPSSLVVFLVALPLCLGVALASGAPLFAGIISGVMGGVVVGAISRSPLSVSGPAAGLTVIVFAAIEHLPTYEAFLLAVCLAGVMQIALGAIRAGVIGDFIPNSVITGMLAAIGLILIMKQIPHAVGYDGDFFGNESFAQQDGLNTISSLLALRHHLLPGAVLLSALSLAFLFWWDKKQAKAGIMRYIPGVLVVVVFGSLINWGLQQFYPALAIGTSHLVSVPVAESFTGFTQLFSLPDIAYITHPDIWITAATLAVVASIESLLSIEAIDKLDPHKRVTPTNRELVAQGFGNMAAGAIGGLPVTSVIVRSSANVHSGARSKLSTIIHGMLLLLSVIAIPKLLNTIPLAVLAAVLISVGYKLTKPVIYWAKYEKGWSYFVPFVITVAAIILSDLLVGICIGVAVASIFILVQNYRSAILCVTDGNNYLIRFKKDLFFLHKSELKQALSVLPEGASVVLDFSRLQFIDHDNIDIINDFITSCQHRKITLTIRHNEEIATTKQLKEPIHAAA